MVHSWWLCCIISVVSGMADGWCGNEKGVGETVRIWWKDKEKVLICNVNIDGRNICKYENNCGA